MACIALPPVRFDPERGEHDRERAAGMEMNSRTFVAAKGARVWIRFGESKSDKSDKKKMSITFLL